MIAATTNLETSRSPGAAANRASDGFLALRSDISLPGSEKPVRTMRLRHPATCLHTGRTVKTSSFDVSVTKRFRATHNAWGTLKLVKSNHRRPGTSMVVESRR